MSTKTKTANNGRPKERKRMRDLGGTPWRAPWVALLLVVLQLIASANASLESKIDHNNDLFFPWRGRIEFEREWSSSKFDVDNNATIGKVESVAQDTEGNSFVCGSFEGTVKFSATTILLSPVETFFLAKYSVSGKLVFALTSDKTSWTSNSVTSGCKYVGVRANGDIVVAGWFSGADFGLGGYGVTLENENNKESSAAFVARLSYDTGKVVAFQDLVTCSSRDDEDFGVVLQAVHLDCRSGKMSLAASLKGFCMITTKSAGSTTAVAKVAHVANGDGVIIMMDDHISVEFRQSTAYSIALIQSPTAESSISFDAITVGTIHNSLDTTMANAHHDKKTLDSHSTETRVYTVIRVVSNEARESFELVLDKSNVVPLKSTNSVVLASYYWKAEESTSAINTWHQCFDTENVVVKQLALNNPTYQDAIAEHRPEEVLYVLGSKLWPFIQKLNASNGVSLWMKNIQPKLHSNDIKIPYYQIDSLQFYRTGIAVSGRVQISHSNDKSPISVMQSPPFSLSFADEGHDNLVKETTNSSPSDTTSKFSFVTAIPQTYPNSAAKEDPFVVEIKTFIATSFTSADSPVLLSSDVTNNVALFVASFMKVLPSAQRYEVLDRTKQNTPNEPSAVLYMGRTSWGATNGDSSTSAAISEDQTESNSFFDMMLRVHHHHPDWETRLGLKGASSTQVFFAFLACVGYIALVIVVVRWIRRNVSVEKFYRTLPPPVFAT